MKSLRGLAVASCLALPLAAGAADNYTLAIGATVLSKSNCKFTSAAGSTLAFGNIDPSGGTNATASLNLLVRCGGSAASAAFSVTSDDGSWSTGPAQPRLRHTVTTTAFLAYTLNAPLGGTAPKNTDTTITLTGTITPASYQNALGGAYADTVVLTLAP